VSPERRWRLIVVAAVIALVVAPLAAPLSTASQYLLPFVAFYLLIIPAHELGHAVAGLLVGHRITMLRIGVGPLLFVRHVGGVTLQIHALPLGGATRGFPSRPRRALRLREWIFAAGGLVANVVLYLVLRRLYGRDLDNWEKHPIASIAAGANWAVLFVNALPLRTDEGLMTDGYHLTRIPFWPQRRVEALHALARGQLVTEELARGDLARAQELAEEHRRRAPHLASSANPLGLVLERLGRHEDARTVWRAGLAQADEPRLAAVLKNNVAFASAMLGRAADMPEAAQLSAEALAAAPDVAAVVSTRGAVLVRMGRGAEALPLLQHALELTNDARERASLHVFLARAFALVGRGDEAQRSVQEARRLDPSHPLLDWAASEAPLVEGQGAPIDGAVTDVGATDEHAVVAAAARAAAEAEASAAAQKRWRRDARILGFATVVVLAERMGVPHLAFLLVGIYLSIVADPASVLALALMCGWAFVVQTSGQLHFGLEPWAPPPTGAAVAALGGAAAAVWLLRRARMVRFERTRGPVVLGIVAGVVVGASLLATAMSSRMDVSAFQAHNTREAVSESGPMLLLLGALWLTSRRRWLRVASAAPFAIALAGTVGASDLWLARRVLADVPTAGSSITWGEATKAVAVRTRKLPSWRARVEISPHGAAFLSSTDFAHVQVDDFGARSQVLDAYAAHFLDDERLLLLHAAPSGAPTLSEVWPFEGGRVGWSKPVPLASSDRPTLAFAFDRTTRQVFVEGKDDDERPLVLSSFADATSAFVPVPAPPATDGHPDEDDDGDFPVERYFTTTGVGEIRARELSSVSVPDGSGFAARWALMRGRPVDVFMQGPTTVWHLPPSLGRVRCASAVGTPIVWCLPAGAMTSFLVRIDARARTADRVPGRMSFAKDVKVLDRTHLLLLRWDELRIVDVEARRATRLSLPDELTKQERTALADGGLAISQGGYGEGPSTVIVFAPPDSPRGRP
jgi:tetratricopeptide (TPR) repeat protein